MLTIRSPSGATNKTTKRLAFCNSAVSANKVTLNCRLQKDENMRSDDDITRVRKKTRETKPLKMHTTLSAHCRNADSAMGPKTAIPIQGTYITKNKKNHNI